MPAPFLKKLPAGRKFAIETRNKNWLDARFADVLREYNVALTLTETSFVPRPWEMKQKIDLATTDWTYVRWLGDRKQIEELTETWDKTIIDRTSDLKNWVEIFREFVAKKKENLRLRRTWASNGKTLRGHVEERIDSLSLLFLPARASFQNAGVPT